MEDNLSLSIFVLSFVVFIWIIYITYEPIQSWAWSDVKKNKKTHGNGSFRKNTCYKYITESE
ncbi:hypothetical protein COF81_19750 [Bacillus pseudomycoides]|uniref:Phage protein n=1 Tax=Bacillus pseudomycoides TaxID=64104 RepID=A0ABD6T2F0_9BACI|nr:hypothetical protein [Bacillus pseudomycoides]PHE92493.1 hypothetical protein COF81_19750 [Bacillus pseudomycoides]